MKFMRNYNEDDMLSKLLMLYFSFQHGVIGIFFITINSDSPHLYPYEKMSMMLPIEIWGLLLIASSVFFIMSVLQENIMEYWFMILSGLTGVVPFGMFAMISIELPINQITTLNYVIIASIDIVIAILGGVALWLRRTT